MNLSDTVRTIPDTQVIMVAQTTNGTPPANGWVTRPIHDLLYNTIEGASFSAPQISLPAGKYMAMLAGGTARINHVKDWIYDVTNAEYVGVTENYANMNYNNNTDGISTDITFGYCPFILTDTAVVEHRTYCNSRSSSYWGHYNDVVESAGENNWNTLTKIIRYDNV